MERGDRDDADHLSYRCKFSLFKLDSSRTLKNGNGAAVDLREIPAIIGGDQKSRHGVVLAKSPCGETVWHPHGGTRLRMPFVSARILSCIRRTTGCTGKRAAS